MCTIIKKFANTGLAYIYVPNPNLDGTGTLATVISGISGGNGTTINSVTIKALGTTTEGMIRLFIFDGTNYFLWEEINVPALIQSTTVATFQFTLNEELTLSNSQTLCASTQNNEGFNVYADGVSWIDCSCSNNNNCAEEQVFANTGMATVSQANPYLNGSGSIINVVTAPTGALVNGTNIPYIDIKAQQSTSQGMIRIFIFDGTTYFCIWEVPIPGTTQTSVEPSYRIICISSINLKAGYSLAASTQNNESFNIITFATDLINCPC